MVMSNSSRTTRRPALWDTPAAPWLPILVIHIRSQVKRRQSQSYKSKKIAKISNLEIFQETDGRMEWNQYTPNNFVVWGGITTADPHLCNILSATQCINKLVQCVRRQSISALLQRIQSLLFHPHCLLNSLAPGKFEWNFRNVIFKQILVTAGWGICYEIALIWMSLDWMNNSCNALWPNVAQWCHMGVEDLDQQWFR